MITYPQMGRTGDARVLPAGASDLLTGTAPNIWATAGIPPLLGNVQFKIAGAEQPWPGIQDGIMLTDGLKGLSPGFKHIDLKGARQQGVTYTGTVGDVLEIDMNLQAHANTPQGMSRVVSQWVSMWKPENLNTFEYWTNDRGYWYFPARRSQPWPDTIKQLPRTILVQNFTHAIRCESGFWFGVPYTSSFSLPDGITSSASGFLPLMNIGTEDGWPTLLLTGPGTFSWSNGPSQAVNSMITMGPLLPGQRMLITTQPRTRNVIDLTNAPVQALTPTQQLLEQIINFVTSNNVPPLLQAFESRFGILPPQGIPYSLLSGIYSNPIPGVAQPQDAGMNYLAVAISGGDTSSSIVGRIDPQRVWPE